MTTKSQVAAIALIVLSIIALSSASGQTPAPVAFPQAPGQFPAANAARYPVAHMHALTQCIGYLSISGDRIQYAVVKPQSESRHSFDVARGDIQSIQQWVFLGTPQNAVEIRTTSGNYHFLLLPDTADLARTQPAQWGVRNAAPVATLLAALGAAPPAPAYNPGAPTGAVPTPGTGGAYPAPGYPYPASQPGAPGYPAPSPNGVPAPGYPAPAQTTGLSPYPAPGVNGVPAATAPGAYPAPGYPAPGQATGPSPYPAPDPNSVPPAAAPGPYPAPGYPAPGQTTGPTPYPAADPNSVPAATAPGTYPAPGYPAPGQATGPSPYPVPGVNGVPAAAPGAYPAPGYPAPAAGTAPTAYPAPAAYPAPGYPAPATGTAPPAYPAGNPNSPPPTAPGAIANAAPMPNVVGPNSLAEYVYTPPPGWTRNQYPDGIVLTSPTYNTGERCLLSMWPFRNASANLSNDAAAAFQSIFSTYQLRDRTSDGFDMPTVLIRGTSGQGWDYVILKRGIGKPPGPGGPFETLQGFVLAARLNSNVAIISGISKRSLVSSCLGELVGDVWPRFFYSLRFRDWPSVDQAPAMMNRLAGSWSVASATVADQIQFASNGRYDKAAASQNYNLLSTGQVLTTTQGFFGSGTYTLQENAITLQPDPGKGPPESGWYRLEEESKDGGRTWTPVFYLLRVSTVDGKDYEVRYLRQ